MTSELEKRLKELGSLEENWDGYGEGPVPEHVLDKARIILEILVEKYPNYFWQIVPCSNGIQIENHSNDFDIEIAIFPAGD